MLSNTHFRKVAKCNGVSKDDYQNKMKIPFMIIESLSVWKRVKLQHSGD